MGSLYRIRCTRCELDQTEALGIGMMGISLSLWVCRNCRTLVTVDDELHQIENNPDPQPCPHCSEVLEAIPESRLDSEDERLDLAACPVCAGRLQAEWTGLWD